MCMLQWLQVSINVFLIGASWWDLITELERAHLEWSSLAASSQWRPKGSYASPRQTLNIIRTAIIPSLSYAFAVTPCSYPNLDKSDAMIGRVIKSKHNLWQSTLLAAMIREDVHSFGLGAPSIYVEYHRRSTVALVTSLEDPSERHQSVTVHLLTHQVAQLKALATTFLSTREGTSLPIPIKRLHSFPQDKKRCYTNKMAT